MPIDSACTAFVGRRLICVPSAGFSDWVLYEHDCDRRFDFVHELPEQLPFKLDTLVAHANYLRAGIGQIVVDCIGVGSWWLTFALREGFLDEELERLNFRNFGDRSADYNLSLSPVRPQLEIDFAVPIVAWAKHSPQTVRISGYGIILYPATES